MDFQYNTVRKDDELTLTLTGRLDTMSAVELDKEVKRIVADLARRHVIDITGLTYISSSGLRCFIELLKGCKAAGAEIRITGMQPAIREIFTLTGFTNIFDID